MRDIMPVVMSETSDEFRKGFDFAVHAILDYMKYTGTTYEMTIDLLTSTTDLMEKNRYWPEKLNEQTT